MRTGYGGPLGPSTPPGVPSISGSSGTTESSFGGSNEASSGGEFAGGLGYAAGGPVRRKRRRMRRKLAQRPGMVRRKRRLRPRPRPVGYAAGGAVNPTLMSLSLDSRSKNPMHEAEDREALSTRPPDPPGKPNASGYTTGYEEGGEVFDEDEIWEEPVEQPEPPERPEQDDMEEEPLEARQPPEEAPLEDEEEPQPLEEEQEFESEEGGGGGGGEGGVDGGGGGGGAEAEQPPTGYQKMQEPDQEEEPLPDTGFGPQAQADRTTPLKEVLDYTRKQLGVEAPAAEPETAADDRQRAAASMATAQAAAPSGQSGATSQVPGETEAEPTLPPPPVPEGEAAPRAPAPRQAASTQPSGTQSGPGNMQAIQDYVSGKGGMTPEQMTDLLDRTNQTDPRLGQNGAIQTAFKNLVDKKDIDGASKFVQALRPSYDSVRALMIAATRQGDFAGAMQLAEKLNNLIPNGDETRFTQTPDGQILATIQPDDRPQTQHLLSPDQFKRYADSPLSLFDHTAEQGLDKNFTMLTGQPGKQGNTQVAQAAGPMPSDSGRMTMNDASPVGTPTAPRTAQAPAARPAPAAQPPAQTPAQEPQATSWTRTRGPNGELIIQRVPAGGTAAPAAQTGYNPQQRQEISRQGQQIIDEHTQRTGIQPQQSQPRPQAQPGQLQPPAPRVAQPQQQVQRESPAMRDYRIAKKAYDAFPYSDQRTQRGRYQAQLELAEQRRESRQGGGGGDKMAIEQMKQDNLNYRVQKASEDRNLRTQAMRDNNWITAATKALTESQSEYFKNYRIRAAAWAKEHPETPYKSPDPEQAAEDTLMFKRLLKDAAHNGLDFTQARTPAAGGQQDRPPAAGGQRQQAQPTQAQPVQEKLPEGVKPLPAGVSLKTYRGDTPPNGEDFPPDSPYMWGYSKSTGEWSIRPNPKYKPPAPGQ